MANQKDIKKEKPKKEKRKRKPIYEVEGFVLTIPKEKLEDALRSLSKSTPKKIKD